jgi:tRNA-splicing endonuclease subunit Sen34
MADVTVEEPIPISKISDHYLIFDADAVAYLRRVYRICGVLIGNIPRATQQNIFSGIPLELMPEEARLLVLQGHAYVVDDVHEHDLQASVANPHHRQEYLIAVEKKGLAAANALRTSADQRKAKWRVKSGQSANQQQGKRKSEESPEEIHDDTSLFSSVRSTGETVSHKATKHLTALCVTPTLSYPLVKTSSLGTQSEVPEATPSYPLFSHLHSKGYYLLPGLRFGCQYTIYPGDPLRYHSHFLAVSKAWDEPIDLLDVLGGGRLGTRVKKGYLLGGVEEEPSSGQKDEPSVRTYCIEWVAM